MPIKIYKLFILTTIFWVIHLQASNNDGKLLWQIGKLDHSAAEFALSAKNSYKEFVPQGFGGENSFYLVNKSAVAKDWSCILPGPRDGFAGYGYWSGRALRQLPIYFEIDKLTSTGSCTLIIDFVEVSSSQPPLFRAIINGKPYNKQLKAGKSGNNPNNYKPHPQTVSFSFPVTELKKGINEIIFQNMTGNWSLFDAIRLKSPPKLTLNNPQNTILKSIKFANFEMVKDAKQSQPLLIDLHQQKNRVSIKVVVAGKEITKNVEAGHSILEFYFPAVKKEKWSCQNIY